MVHRTIIYHLNNKKTKIINFKGERGLVVLVLAREAGDLVTERLKTDGINYSVYVAKFVECLLTDLDLMSISTD